MSLAILFHFLCAQRVSGIKISIIRSLRLFCWITTLVVLFLVRCGLEIRLQAEAYNTDTTPTQPHRISNPRRTKNKTTNVVIQQNSRKLLMMDILMSETCWAHKKWNKIASDIKLVFYSSTPTSLIMSWEKINEQKRFRPIILSDIKPCFMLHSLIYLKHFINSQCNFNICQN